MVIDFSKTKPEIVKQLENCILTNEIQLHTVTESLLKSKVRITLSIDSLYIVADVIGIPLLTDYKVEIIYISQNDNLLYINEKINNKEASNKIINKVDELYKKSKEWQELIKRIHQVSKNIQTSKSGQKIRV